MRTKPGRSALLRHRRRGADRGHRASALFAPHRLAGDIGPGDIENQLHVASHLTKRRSARRPLGNTGVEVPQLGRKTEASQQSPALMDERDKLLRELSSIAKINVVEDRSGQVTISLDGGNSQSAIVRKDSTTLIGVKFTPGDLGRVDILYNPYGESRPISSVSAGTLGGLINFRSQILSPAMDGLDHLAQTFTAEVNAIHTAGIDARGDRGKEIFEIEPVFQVTSPTLLGMVEVDVDVSDINKFDYLCI